MIRACPKCGDYYADASLAFCLVDGAPLINVDPSSERWSEGARVIEKKEIALRRQKRKLKWRRVLLSATTMLIAVMVVLVVAANSLIYLRPQQEEDEKPLTPATAPTDSTAPVAHSEPVNTPTPQTRPTPKPTVSPITKEITPPPRDTKPPATPTPTPDKSPECSEADKNRERKIIIERFGATWRKNIEGDRRKIITESLPLKLPIGVANGEASLGTLEYTSAFSKTCTTASVTVRYVWQVRTNINGTRRVLPISKQKKFACVKIGGTWRCS